MDLVFVFVVFYELRKKGDFFTALYNSEKSPLEVHISRMGICQDIHHHPGTQAEAVDEVVAGLRAACFQGSFSVLPEDVVVLLG